MCEKGLNGNEKLPGIFSFRNQSEGRIVRGIIFGISFPILQWGRPGAIQPLEVGGIYFFEHLPWQAETVKA